MAVRSPYIAYSTYISIKPKKKVVMVSGHTFRTATCDILIIYTISGAETQKLVGLKLQLFGSNQYFH